MRGPVQRAEEGAGGHGRIGGVERAGLDAAGDQRADAALVPIALGHDAPAEPGRQRIDLEVRGRSFDLVDQAQHMGRRQRVQARRQRSAVPARRAEGHQQAPDRAILAEEEQFVFPGKIVIEVAERQVGGRGDVAHPGGGETARPEDPRRGAHDLDAPGLGPNRTAVRKLNHRSILHDRDRRPPCDKRPGGLPRAVARWANISCL